MNNHIKRFVEQELTDYHRTVKIIAETMQEIEEEVIFGQSDYNPVGRRRNGIDRPTERKALKMISLKSTRWLQEAQRRAAAIERAMLKMPVEHKQLIRFKYWAAKQPLTTEGTAMKMNVSESTIRRWNKQILALVAMEMGLL